MSIRPDTTTSRTSRYGGRTGRATAPQPTDVTSTYACTYDAWNRLVKVEATVMVGETPTTFTIQKNEYDGLNRRVKKHIDSEAQTEPDGVDVYRHFFYNSGWQIVETRKTTTESDAPQDLDTEMQYVWSARYIDAPILRDRDADDDSETGDLGKTGSGLEERIYYTTDANMNVTGLFDTSAVALEHYVYDAYGHLLHIYDGDWSTSDADQISDYANNILFAGYYRDYETGFYHVRNRMYHAELGRWHQRDPLGYVDGMSLYEYVASRPTIKTDPQGLAITVILPAVFHLVGLGVELIYDEMVRAASEKGMAGLDAKKYCDLNGKLRGTGTISNRKTQIHKLLRAEDTPTWDGFASGLSEKAVDTAEDMHDVNSATASTTMSLRICCTDEGRLRYNWRAHVTLRAVMSDNTVQNGSQEYPVSSGTFDDNCSAENACCE